MLDDLIGHCSAVLNNNDNAKFFEKLIHMLISQVKFAVAISEELNRYRDKEFTLLSFWNLFGRLCKGWELWHVGTLDSTQKFELLGGEVLPS